MFYRISMQICGYDAFVITLSSFTCYDTVSYYDTILISLIINWCATSAFCMHRMHDSSIVASLNHVLGSTRGTWNVRNSNQAKSVSLEVACIGSWFVWKVDLVDTYQHLLLEIFHPLSNPGCCSAILGRLTKGWWWWREDECRQQWCFTLPPLPPPMTYDGTCAKGSGTLVEAWGGSDRGCRQASEGERKIAHV
jgi:hypothetical protein